MLNWRRLYQNTLYYTLKLLVKSKLFFSDFFSNSNINSRKPIIYILPTKSIVDLVILRIICAQQGFPDPLISLVINNCILPRYIFIHEEHNILSHLINKPQQINILYDYCQLHYVDPKIDVQMVLVSVIIGRSPGRQIQPNLLLQYLRFSKNINKIFNVLWFGRDSVIHISNLISIRQLVLKYFIDKTFILKLARVARIYFVRQRMTTIGPRLPIQENFFAKLLETPVIIKAVSDEARAKKISIYKAKQNAILLINEIAANISYKAICLSELLIRWICNRFYQGLHVNNIERVRKLAQKGHKIIYLPCHRSHMDYFLLSYVLYHQGLAPPHIAAGINLNFYPAGSILRRLGGFFIRRSFKGNKLYSSVLRQYITELLDNGCPIEYFLEGGRSRTGRLLIPKTGMLSMTIQAMLCSSRPITLVPVYIGYEHVIEIASYAKELYGAEKETEGLRIVARSLRKLHNLGQGYINFGEPLTLVSWLNKKIPQWVHSINHIEAQRPSWLPSAVDKIAFDIMVRINNAAAANAINICSSVLLSSRQWSLTEFQLLTQLSYYMALLRNVPYSEDVTIPNLAPEELLNYALKSDKFQVANSSAVEKIIFLSRDQALVMTYYRNNIHHLFILPSLIACIINANLVINREDLIKQIMLIYQLLKTELFMRFEISALPSVIDRFIAELHSQGLINIECQQLRSSPSHFHDLELLAGNVSTILQRYVIVFYILSINPRINRITLEKQSFSIAKGLSAYYSINSLECFDKNIFTTLVNTLRNEGYIQDNGNVMYAKVAHMHTTLSALLDPDVLMTIQNINDHHSSYVAGEHPL